MPALVIGLGNPGGEYARTRHNVGWMCLDELERRGRFSRERREGLARVREGSVEGFEMVLARPQTYMNLSGRAGVALTQRFGVSVEDVIVVHDDVDLPLGRIQVRRGGSAGGQKGVQSLIDSWRRKDFIRIRIGVGRPPEGMDTADHVLDPFRPEEREQLPDLLHRAADAVLAVLGEGLERAMERHNRRQPRPQA